jgi:hypothetical protein
LEKTYSSTALSTTNPTLIFLGSNPDQRDEKAVITRPSYDTILWQLEGVLAG